MGQVAVMGAEGQRGAAGRGSDRGRPQPETKFASFRQFLFSDQMVRPYPVFGRKAKHE